MVDELSSSVSGHLAQQGRLSSIVMYAVNEERAFVGEGLPRLKSMAKVVFPKWNQWPHFRD